MSRQFLVPLQLPANPANPLEATTKQYVDTADAAKVNGTTRITVASTAPSSPATGDLWVDTT